MVSGGMTCVKYLLFLFNLIFAITGVIFVAVGAVILGGYKGYSNFVDNWFFAIPVLMIVVGVVVFLVSFFGCCGAVKENHCMIITFSLLLLLIFALELGAGISGYMMRDEVGTMLDSRLKSTINEYKERPEAKSAWDIMQHDLNCCGIANRTDWSHEFQSNDLPDSCCTEILSNEKCNINSLSVRPAGCKDKLRSAIEDNAVILGGVGIGIALVQLIGVIFACCLARSIRREYETV